MGFFDKVKTFVGAHGVKVEYLELERQPPTAVVFPITDSVFKGKYRITAEKPCTVLAHKHEVMLMKKHPDGREEHVTLGEEVHDERVNDTGHRLRWPHEMKAGDVIEHWMIVGDIDIPASLRRLGYADPAAAIDDPALTFFVRVTIDVKGTPMDADTKQVFRLRA
ncbi:MAG: hypothetical protein K1X88_18255 [Nannocystaceae bacterium]|nr:hypothetical protein [Nannocystaceae bacterium]